MTGFPDELMASMGCRQPSSLIASVIPAPIADSPKASQADPVHRRSWMLGLPFGGVSCQATHGVPHGSTETQGRREDPGESLTPPPEPDPASSSQNVPFQRRR